MITIGLFTVVSHIYKQLTIIISIIGSASCSWSYNPPFTFSSILVSCHHFSFKSSVRQGNGEFLYLGFSIRVSVSGYQYSVISIRVSVSGYQYPGISIRISVSGYQYPGITIRVSVSGYQYLGFSIRVAVFSYQYPGISETQRVQHHTNASCLDLLDFKL